MESRTEASRWRLVLRRSLLAGVLGLLGALGSAGSAAADTVLGQTTGSSTGDCSTGYPYTQIQLSTGGPPSYTVPAGGGTITSWSHQGGPAEAGQLTLKVYRPSANLNVWTVAGVSAPMTMAANTLGTSATNLPVQAGDVLGYTRAATSHMTCLLTTSSSQDVVTDAAGADTPLGMPTSFSGPGPSLRINISAVLQPPQPPMTAPTGQRAAALAVCKKRARKHHWPRKRLRRCKREANSLPI